MKYSISFAITIAAALAVDVNTINPIKLEEEAEVIWTTPVDFDVYTAKNSDEFSQNGSYFTEIQTSEFAKVYMWVTLTVFDGLAPDGTYFFNYFQVEQREKPGTYESFSCWAPYKQGEIAVPPEEITVANYYGKQTFETGQATVDGRAMEFINAETRTPDESENMIWKPVEAKLAESYKSDWDAPTQKSLQACTASRAIDATKDFNIKSGVDYNFLAGFKVFPSKDATDSTARGDSTGNLSFKLEGAQAGLTIAASSIIALSTIFS